MRRLSDDVWWRSSERRSTRLRPLTWRGQAEAGLRRKPAAVSKERGVQRGAAAGNERGWGKPHQEVKDPVPVKRHLAGIEGPHPIAAGIEGGGR